MGLVKSCLLSGRVGIVSTADSVSVASLLNVCNCFSLFCSWYGPLPSPSWDDLGDTCISLHEEGPLLVVSVVEVL